MSNSMQEQEGRNSGQVDLDEVQRRVSVLDHDLTNCDHSAIKAAATMIAGWYVEDCDRMAAELRAAREELRSADERLGLHHALIKGATGKTCTICAHEQAWEDQAVGGGVS
jgi:hypothetical protein